MAAGSGWYVRVWKWWKIAWNDYVTENPRVGGSIPPPGTTLWATISGCLFIFYETATVPTSHFNQFHSQPFDLKRSLLEVVTLRYIRPWSKNMLNKDLTLAFYIPPSKLFFISCESFPSLLISVYEEGYPSSHTSLGYFSDHISHLVLTSCRFPVSLGQNSCSYRYLHG